MGQHKESPIVKIEFDIYRAGEFRALATFANALADEAAAEASKHANMQKFGLGAVIGGVSGWKHHGSGEAPVEEAASVEEDPAQVIAETNFAPTGAAKPARERGKPSPGHARRTKAEIAEDDAAAATGENGLDAAKALIAEAVAPVETVVEDSPEVQAADAADEAAETAAAKAPDAAPTVEAIRDVLGLYQKIYGLPATMEDGPKILSEVCGEGVVKVSAVPDDKIAAVIAALKKAGNENRFGRTAVAS
jgi:hypothetical protein